MVQVCYIDNTFGARARKKHEFNVKGKYGKEKRNINIGAIQMLLKLKILAKDPSDLSVKTNYKK